MVHRVTRRANCGRRSSRPPDQGEDPDPTLSPAASERFCATVLPALGIADPGDFRLAQARRGLAWAC